MKKNLIFLIYIVAILFLPLASYSQTNLLTNGSFETGNFNGWTTTNTQTNTYCTNWSVRTAGALNCNQTASTPRDGSFGVISGFDGRGGTMSLYQDVAIPSLAGTRLTFTYRINWNIPSAANQARRFDVQVRDTSNNVLETVHTFIANSGAPNQTSGVRTEQISLNNYFGQTIRLTFLLTIPQSFTGPGQFEIDNVFVESFGPTAAEVGVGGRVESPNGYGIKNAFVSFTDSDGVTRIAHTNQFGYFKFDNVEVGNTYVFEVNHKQYEFPDSPRVILLDGATKDIVFTSSSQLLRKTKTIKSKPKIE